MAHHWCDIQIDSLLYSDPSSSFFSPLCVGSYDELFCSALISMVTEWLVVGSSFNLSLGVEGYLEKCIFSKVLLGLGTTVVIYLC